MNEEKKRGTPTVAIVGRPNVGKSAIFNRLAGRRISIVHDQPGVTRDRIAARCTLGALPFEVVDTGGIGAALDDGFAAQVRMEADIAVASADLILFVVDAQSGIVPIDEELATVLRKAGRETILLVNKVDVDKHENLATDFSRLGFESQIAVSAEHGRNFSELMAEVDRRLLERFERGDEEGEAERDRIRMAIVGRPNVGKSSLINAILEDDRTIVSDVAGTTRDAVDVPYERGGRYFTLIDTAGIRRRNQRDTSVEVFSAMRSERSIRRADLCLLVVDASSGVTAMDRTIAQQIMEAEKPCIVVANKFDLFHPEAKMRDRVEELMEQISTEFFFLRYAPVAAVSALKGAHLSKIFGAIEKVEKAARTELGTGVLNRFLRTTIERSPAPVRKNRKLNLLYATAKRRESSRPLDPPKFLLFVNHADLMTRTYERFLENELRAEFDLTGLPVSFQVRSRQSRKGEKV